MILERISSVLMILGAVCLVFSLGILVLCAFDGKGILDHRAPLLADIGVVSLWVGMSIESMTGWKKWRELR